MKNCIRIAVVGLAFGLTGCGFSPLYGTSDSGTSVALKLATINVSEQNSRLGQLVRNEIVSGISPACTAAGTAYRLELEAKGSEEEAISALDSEALRKHYTANVVFVLYSTDTNKPVYSGKTFSQVAYDRVDAPVANLQAEVNAQERAARETGRDIRTRLAAYLSTH